MSVDIKQIHRRAINLIELIAFAEQGSLKNWQPTIRAAVRFLAKEELAKYDQAMETLRHIREHSEKMSNELNSSELRDKMRHFVKATDAVLSSESDSSELIENS